MTVDLAVLTANVAQVFLTDEDWGQTFPERTHVFDRGGAVITSDSTLRFRSRVEVEQSLRSAGYVREEVRDAPDRPGRELVFIAAAGTQR